MAADRDQRLEDFGVVRIPIGLGTKSFEWPFFIAKMSDDLILGCDILDSHDVSISTKNGLMIDSQWLPCRVDRTVLPHQIKLDRTVVVPPESELVFPVGTPSRDSPQMMLEPVVEDSRGVLVARAVVDASVGTVPVRVVNLSKAEVKLQKGYIVGELQEVQEVRDVKGGSAPSIPVVEAPESAIPSHLVELYDRCSQGIDSDDVRNQLACLLIARQGAFAKDKLDLGNFKLAKHSINTGGANPVRQAVRRTPKGFEGEDEKYLKEQLEAGVVRPSSSPWASPVVLVRKRDGSVRWCVDYRRLNDVTVKDAFPLPRTDMCLESLGGSKVFSALDLQAGYWNIELEPDDRPKSAFITKFGLFEYTKMPFGLCNAGSTLSRGLNMLFSDIQWKSMIMYLDDITVMGRDYRENLDNLSEVLYRLESSGLKLKPSKCDLLRKEITFLGHCVSSEGVRPNPRLLEAVKEWKTPRNQKEVMSFHGLCAYYRRFIRNFSQVAFPLTELTAKDTLFQWGPREQRAFEQLVEMLCESPLLALPREDGNWILDTDASDVGVGAVLSQVQDGVERPIAYGSKKLNKAQRRYCTTRKELLAVVTFMKEYRHYLYGRPFTVRTDHGSLRWLLNFKEPQGQLARWIQVIQEYDYRIEHRPGKRHGNADALSRTPPNECERSSSISSLPCGGCSECKRKAEQWVVFDAEVDNVIPLAAKVGKVRTRRSQEIPKFHEFATIYSKSELSELQRQDPDLSNVCQWVEAGRRPERDEVVAECPAVRSYWLQFESLFLEEGVLYLRWAKPWPGRPERRLVIPSSLVPKVLSFCHDHVFSAHMGIRRTIERCKSLFYWYRLGFSVREHVRQCETCQKTRGASKSFRAELMSFRVGYPLDRVAVDLITKLPLTAKGNRNILVIVDHFTRWVEAFAIPDQCAETVARFTVREFVSRFGAPLELHSDQGRNFESHIFQEVCRLLGIRKTRTSAYRPQSNGAVERFNRTLHGMIKAYVAENRVDWDEHLPYVMAAYRGTVHPATGFSPNFLMFGREVHTPCQLAFGLTGGEQVKGAGDFPSELQSRLSNCYRVVRENLKRYGERMKRDYDIRANKVFYDIGQSVYRRYEAGKRYDPRWAGPFTIQRKINDVLYEVTGPGGQHVVHHDRLKPAEPIGV